MSTLRPSQVRIRILREHSAIREQLELLEAHSARLLAGHPGSFVEAQRELQSFHHVLREHIDFEDALLVPALADTDAWGTLRAQKLASHHKEQRQQMEALATRSLSEPPAGLARLLTGLIDELRTDMNAEEREYLSADLLRDDVVSDAEDG